MTRGRIAAVTAVAMVLTVAGLRIAGTANTSSGHSGSRPVVPPTVAPLALPQARPGPRTLVDGVPQGWSRDRGGARAAAVSAVSLTGAVARAGFITRDDMIRALASRRFGPTLASESARQLAEMTGQLGQVGVSAASVVFRELPLTARVVSADADRAEVTVWSVLVLAVPNVGAPRQAWRTVTVDLVWENRDWRIDGWTAHSGPTPAMDDHGTVASTDQITEVAAWPSTIGGG